MPGRALSLLALIVVGGCTTPLQNCISRASAPLLAVQTDIARTSANLSRGYAIHRQVVRTPITFCTTFGNRSKNVGIFVSGCTDPYRRIETPVPIDAALERERLAQLRDQELNLRAQSQRQINTCYSAFAEPAAE